MKTSCEGYATKKQPIKIGGVVFTFLYDIDSYHYVYKSDEDLYFMFKNTIYKTNYISYKYLEGGFTVSLRNNIVGKRDFYHEMFIENIESASKDLNKLKKILLLQ